MKKTMFITSVIMVVVMAIALTTSSLAWFTSGNGGSVTTTKLTLTAKANATSGINISNDASNWSISANLVSDSGISGQDNTDNGLMPLVPWTEQGTPDKAGLIAALSGKKFIGSEVDAMNKYVGTPNKAGYFSDDLYITNLADGNSAQAVYVGASIAWTRGMDNSEPAQPKAYSYTTGDPVLYVAVLANKIPEGVTEYRHTGGSVVWNTESEGADEENAQKVTRTEDWEIVNIFNSKSATTVNVGKQENLFAAGLAQGGSYSNGNISTYVTGTGRTTTTLATRQTIAGEIEPYGVPKKFRVLAWYDGPTLNNNNSGFDVDFVLTFQSYTTANN